jgi:hypothetical protein
MNPEQAHDYFLAGMIRALEIVQEVRAEGDDLNTVQWHEVIEMRRRDMVDVSKLDEFTVNTDSQKTLEENI